MWGEPFPPGRLAVKITWQFLELCLMGHNLGDKNPTTIVQVVFRYQPPILSLLRTNETAAQPSPPIETGPPVTPLAADQRAELDA